MTQPDVTLPRVRYMGFPFRVGADGANSAARFDHIRQQVEQVLFTSPGERVFRPEFGFGTRRHVFEPNAGALWEYAQNRLYGSLAEALAGEVDPKTLQVEINAPQDRPEVMLVRVRYVIAALQKEEIHEIEV
ncbi:GPW/gp25 family protein [Shimia sp. MMG029]|uniref:GPW/gp25 family protein n=1 Tax=Shimia sp. MMG029 TaxID=3021978 RepID=UPI0022FDE92D|nr:GPW/gp25 family protein [Shimia sp. MMG029]MDA5558507.1 GPW/gp25 family protein [Shimia sp. MMG029]